MGTNGLVGGGSDQVPIRRVLLQSPVRSRESHRVLACPCPHSPGCCWQGAGCCQHRLQEDALGKSLCLFLELSSSPLSCAFIYFPAVGEGAG